MTTQRDVALALRALVQNALPDADVRGFDGDASVPAEIGQGGEVIGFPGDPGEPEVDLSPLAYHFDHPFRMEIAAAGGAGGAPLDAMVSAIGNAIRADRTLGGLCSFLEAQGAVRDDRTLDDVTINWALVTVVASYTTQDPLN